MSESKGWNIARNAFPVPWQIPWQSGRFYSHTFQSGMNTLAPSSISIYMFPVYVPNFNGVTITSLGVEVTSGVTGSASRIAVYEYIDDEIPGKLLVDGGFLLTTSNGYQSTNVSRRVPQGWYLVAFAMMGGVSTVRSINNMLMLTSKGTPYSADTTLNSTALRYTNFAAASINDIVTSGFPQRLPVDTANLQIPLSVPRAMIGV